MPLPQNIWSDANLMKVLKDGGVVVMPTDTLYGIVGKALDESVVNRIYSVRKRNPEKPCIILIGDISELKKFSINLSEKQKNAVSYFWTNPISIVLDCSNETLTYLHRGTKTLAFRLPVSVDLQNLLKEIGPLIAPSANVEGLPPAKDILEAQKYFGGLVDLYVDGGTIEGMASKVIKLHQSGSIDFLRS